MVPDPLEGGERPPVTAVEMVPGHLSPARAITTHETTNNNAATAAALLMITVDLERLLNIITNRRDRVPLQVDQPLRTWLK